MPSIVKITDLVELTTPADGDFTSIVDVSEPLDINKTKKISILNLVGTKMPKNIFTAVGQIIYSTASATLAALSKPSVDSVLKMTSAGIPSWKAITDFSHIYRRQGGDATSWQNTGTTTYTPTNPNIQVGSYVFSSSTASGGYYYQNVPITFPVAYTGLPIIFLTLDVTPVSGKQNYLYSLVQSNYATTGFTATLVSTVPDFSSNPMVFHWMAIGE